MVDRIRREYVFDKPDPGDPREKLWSSLQQLEEAMPEDYRTLARINSFVGLLRDVGDEDTRKALVAELIRRPLATELIDEATTPAGWSEAPAEQTSWTIRSPGHPGRADSPAYLRSRKTINRIVDKIHDFIYGPPPFEVHNGGGLWLKDDKGWFLVRNLAGIEWSAQFCADPAKVDLIRQNATRVYAAFPQAAEELRIRDLLDTPITDAVGIARWTDSICNASIPLRRHVHRAVPEPIADIQFFKYDDFQLWVTDEQGNPAAVLPLSPRGSGGARVYVLWAAEGSTLQRQVAASEAHNQPLVLPAGHAMTMQAFANM
jgi:hypothetical protein